mmetsp:Transcript_6435/g.20526  ORF Transcript_6435/g.20526 Transcript_6435/m.20526 type:complete len:334 (+) Transcript_6435:1387-2388(+)
MPDAVGGAQELAALRLRRQRRHGRRAVGTVAFAGAAGEIRGTVARPGRSTGRIGHRLGHPCGAAGSQRRAQGAVLGVCARLLVPLQQSKRSGSLPNAFRKVARVRSRSAGDPARLDAPRPRAVDETREVARPSVSTGREGRSAPDSLVAMSSLASELIATSESGADRPSRPVLTDGRATSRVSSTARGRGASSRAGSPALRLRTLATLRNALGSDPLRLLCCSGTSSLAHTPRTAPCALRCDPAAPQGCPSRCPIRPVDRPGRATVPRISPAAPANATVPTARRPCRRCRRRRRAASSCAPPTASGIGARACRNQRSQRRRHCPRASGRPPSA